MSTNGENENVDAAIAEATMIRGIAEALATRFGLDLADGTLMDRPILCLLFMCENLLDRVELLEEIAGYKEEESEQLNVIKP